MRQDLAKAIAGKSAVSARYTVHRTTSARVRSNRPSMSTTISMERFVWVATSPPTNSPVGSRAIPGSSASSPARTGYRWTCALLLRNPLLTRRQLPGLTGALTTPLRERLTLFWHDHFATSVQKVKEAELMYRQNEIFRARGAGSFEALAQAVARERGPQSRNERQAP